MRTFRILIVYPGMQPSREERRSISEKGPELVIKSITCEELEQEKTQGKFNLIILSGEWVGKGVKKVLSVIKRAFPGARVSLLNEFKTRILK